MFNSRSILLIDDDIIESMKVRRVLRNLRMDNPLFVCANGEEGLEWLGRNREYLPSVILLDLDMPRMNGIEFLYELAKDEALNSIPVVVLSSSDCEEEKRQCFQFRNVADYKVKPLRFKKYEEVIGSICAYCHTHAAH